MAVSYAEALSPYANKGAVGLPEFYDEQHDLLTKVKQLVHLMQSSRCCVLHTGAGISTSAGIPDFRGPNGVWTLEARNETAKSVDFRSASPTFTHYAINALEKHNIVKFVITQNVDGLHVRSGYPLNRLAELHGNVFCERCDKCGKKYYGSEVIQSIGMKLTGRLCEGTAAGRPCRGKLRDVTLDWEDPIDFDELRLARQFARAADLSICLGTSLQISPANELPLLVKKNDGNLVTVSLQKTKLENTTDIIINAKVNEVMAILLDELDIKVEEGKTDGLVLKSLHPLERFSKRRMISA